ncbi:NADP-dependent oxidoreductase [Amycolatopsis deserti]|uniref:NADP-dependent oxidoreductase n=1 Tax=Amycolatopsis deserti TaxID=185696 RepID=A0ABQ3IIU2_9PSEU|nr:NADP-dependent oxidoreductase [Amycolatopsis deserti]GHE80696.1 NADP-dependent oxidoreductase [Amycolatopsis deserti]
MRNRTWIIRAPSRGRYDPKCLRLEDRDIPALEPGRVLVKTRLLSVDPTTRNWLKLDPDMTFLPLAVGDPMVGVGVGEVVESDTERFRTGDLVSGLWTWQEYAVADPALLEKQTPRDGVPEEAYVSVFSHIGRAAAIGILEVGALAPSDLVVVSGAAGATGGIAVQIAKARGCRVIGIAGGPEKCAYVTEIGADAVIDYKSEDLGKRLAALCPDGVDLFFDNVGGAVLDAVLENMANGCRIVACGAISQYDLAGAADAYGVRNLPLLLFKNARIEGFVVPRFADRIPEFDAVLHDLFATGRLRQRSHVVEGIENAADAVSMLFDGSNSGKLMVRTSA